MDSELPLAATRRIAVTTSNRRREMAHELRVLLLALAGGLPAVAATMIFLWGGDYTPKVQWTVSVLIVSCWLGFAFALRERVVFPIRTISNLLAALREGDYSLRARPRPHDVLGEVIEEINIMGKMLREQRLGAVEATTLLSKVMDVIDVAVFAFDPERKVKLVNRAAERLMALPGERLLGRTADELNLADCLRKRTPSTLERTFPGGAGRWGVRRGQFREHGLPHELLVLSDLTRELREEELKAWQRLVRVLGHELNNSMAPIKSLSASLVGLLDRVPPPADWRDDMRNGLSVIGSRSESLIRFVGAYTQLAKLPEPTFAPVSVRDWVRRVAALETRMKIEIEAGADVSVRGDADQLEQLLINLVRNGVEAAAETGGAVAVGWLKNRESVEVFVRDSGLGLSSQANLFVPFFTTKPGGSGIGLVLSRKIAENHGGSVTLQNRSDGSGCEARLRLPMNPPAAQRV